MIEVLVVLGLLALLFAFLAPAVQKVRQAAARIQDQNNLKRIGLACHAYHDVFKMFPFNGVKNSAADPKDRDSGSWAYQILPYVEQNPLFQSPKDGEGVIIVIYMSPGRSRTGTVTEGKFKGPQTDYAINTWLNDPAKGTLDAPNSRPRIQNITDGTSNTILSGQLALRTTDYDKTDGGEGRESIFVGGTMGTGRNAPKLVGDGPDIDFANRFGGPFPGITNMCFCDGSVRAVSNTVNLQPHLTPNGGEAVNID